MIILYIDPGTGSMLFAAVMGIAAAVMFFVQKALMRLKFFITGGKSGKDDETEHGIVLFSEGARYQNLFSPIIDEFERRGESAEYYTLDPEDPVLLREDQKCVKCTFIGKGNHGFARMNLLKARVVLSTTPGLDVYQWKKSPWVGTYVHIFHAIDSGTSYRMFGIDHYDSVLMTGEFQEDKLRRIEKLRNQSPKELTVVGLPYMDVLLERARNMSDGNKTGETSVLLAPTWGPSGILSRFGSRLIDALLDAGLHVTVRPHPQSLISEKKLIESLERRYQDNPLLKWNFDRDNFDALSHADIMISDFSGAIFDFALVFEKPVIYVDTSYDSSVYDQAWLEHDTGERLWQFEAMEEFGIQLKEEDIPRIGQVVEDALKDEGKKRGLEKVKAESWQYIGQSAKRTVDYLISEKARAM